MLRFFRTIGPTLFSSQRGWKATNKPTGTIIAGNYWNPGPLASHMWAQRRGHSLSCLLEIAQHSPALSPASADPPGFTANWYKKVNTALWLPTASSTLPSLMSSRTAPSLLLTLVFLFSCSWIIDAFWNCVLFTAPSSHRSAQRKKPLNEVIVWVLISKLFPLCSAFLWLTSSWRTG